MTHGYFVYMLVICIMEIMTMTWLAIRSRADRMMAISVILFAAAMAGHFAGHLVT